MSSLGDWIGLFAILAIAARVSNSATAVGFVMVARMLPGFLFAPLGGALIDRWNRKVVMVTSDIGRAGLLVLLPFWENIWGLVVLSFAIEMLTLLWAPAKDATLPNIVKDPDQLASANSLGLVAAFGTFPLGAVMFAALAGIAHWLGGFDALNALGVKQESLAIWVDGSTFLVSALFDLPVAARRRRARDADAGPGRADLDRHQGRAGIHPGESARARRDDRSRGRSHRRRRDRAARCRGRPRRVARWARVVRSAR